MTKRQFQIIKIPVWASWLVSEHGPGGSYKSFNRTVFYGNEEDSIFLNNLPKELLEKYPYLREAEPKYDHTEVIDYKEIDSFSEYVDYNFKSDVKYWNFFSGYQLVQSDWWMLSGKRKQSKPYRQPGPDIIMSLGLTP